LNRLIFSRHRAETGIKLWVSADSVVSYVAGVLAMTRIPGLLICLVFAFSSVSAAQPVGLQKALQGYL
jgi:hypothetical protein